MTIVGTFNSLKAARLAQDTIAEQGRWKVDRLDGEVPVYGKGDEELYVEQVGERIFRLIRKVKEGV